MFAKLLNCWVRVDLMGHLAIWGQLVEHDGPVILIEVPAVDGDEWLLPTPASTEVVNLAGPALYRLETITQEDVLMEIAVRRSWRPQTQPAGPLGCADGDDCADSDDHEDGNEPW